MKGELGTYFLHVVSQMEQKKGFNKAETARFQNCPCCGKITFAYFATDKAGWCMECMHEEGLEKLQREYLINKEQYDQLFSQLICPVEPLKGCF